MIGILPPLGKYKYGTWRILPMKCYIDNFVRLQSCISNVNTYNKDKTSLTQIRFDGVVLWLGRKKQNRDVVEWWEE
jgi:hypothetical protein